MRTPTEQPASPCGDVALEKKRAFKKLKKTTRRPIVPLLVGSTPEKQRKMLADYIKLTAWWHGRPPVPKLPRRLEQVLLGLMSGASEKEIARTLNVSAHTIHDYAKELHKRLGVTSRGELLNRFLPRG